jgi:hypothetical protein
VVLDLKFLGCDGFRIGCDGFQLAFVRGEVTQVLLLPRSGKKDQPNNYERDNQRDKAEA